MNDKKLFNSLKQYFNVLRINGYVKNKEVFKMLYFSFINDFLKDYVGYITEKNYNSILNSMNYMIGESCLVPYESYRKHIETMNMNMGSLRISQFNRLKSYGSQLKIAYI